MSSICYQSMLISTIYEGYLHVKFGKIRGLGFQTCGWLTGQYKMWYYLSPSITDRDLTEKASPAAEIDTHTY